MQKEKSDNVEGASPLAKAWAVLVILANVAVLAEMVWLYFYGNSYTGFIYIFFYYPVALFQVAALLPASLLTWVATREKGSPRLGKTCLWTTITTSAVTVAMLMVVSYRFTYIPTD